MSDLNHFDLTLNKMRPKMLSTLYDDINRNRNQHSYNPQDVIASVSKQLKAIQNADFVNSTKSTAKDFLNYKRTTLLSVTKLSVLDKELPKKVTTFDTQCVTDTQLMSIIEDAEIIDAHQGITQEFETAFAHTNIETQADEYKKYRDMNGCVSANVVENSVTENIAHISDTIDQVNSINENLDKIGFNETNMHRQQLSQVLQANVNSCRSKQSTSVNIENKSDIDNRNNLDTQMNVQRDHNIEIKDCYIERPLSPVFKNKNLKMKSPSPLVFNLDKFEQFETIALSLLINADNNNSAKHIINSQILNRELHLNINKDVVYCNSNNFSPDLVENVNNPHNPITHTPHVKEATSRKSVSKKQQSFNDNVEKQNKTDKNLSHDEILFSSDEEENYIHRKYQNLPLTSNLENSFCHQSEILDNTLYVGFQTASNRSIQVSAGSFAKAKSLLSDAIIDEMSVAELVNTYEILNKDKSVPKNEKENNEDKLLNSITENEGKSLHFAENKVQQPLINELSILPNHQMGFMTASNKNISLSKKALARCRKVFQDIDLNENFDCTNIKDITQKLDKGDIYDRKRQQIANAGTNSVSSVLEGFDDEIIQEFENFEMSLEDLKGDEVSNVESFNNITISKVTAQEINREALKETCFHENRKRDIVLSQIIGSRHPVVDISNSNHNNIRDFSKSNHHFKNKLINECSKNNSREIGGTKINASDPTERTISETRLVYFNTSNYKTVKSSGDTLVQSINISNDKDIENINEENKSIKTKVLHPDEILQENQINTRYTGFQMASNKKVQVSKEALAQSRNIFKDLNDHDKDINDKNKSNEEKVLFPENILQENQVNMEVKTKFTGFQTASNKPVKVSKEALAKSRNIFQDLNNLEDINDEIKSTKAKELFPENILQENPINMKVITRSFRFQTATDNQVQVSQEALVKSRDVNNLEVINDENKNTRVKALLPEDINQKNDINVGVKTTFNGFQTAINKQVQISKEALAESRNIFNDLNNLKNLNVEHKSTKVKILSFENMLQTNPINLGVNSRFTGFKTASNKEVQVSKEALAKSSNVFKDLNDLLNINDENKSVKIKAVYPDEILHENQINMVINDSPVTQSVLPYNGAFKGFQTASKKPVAISQIALAKSKKVFADLDTFDQKATEVFSPGNNKVVQGLGKTLFDNKILVDEPQSQILEMFQTASHKNVLVSKDALVETKNLFHDMDTKNNDVQEGICKSLNFNLGFKTGNNQAIITSEESEKSKRLFSELDKDDTSRKRDKITHTFEDNNATLDTQLVDNFNVTLYTDDFTDTRKNFKRAGSPILSCPRAKKRKKFETPYTAKNKANPTQVKPIEVAVLKTNKICYREDYKKNKIYNLKYLHNMAKNLMVTVDPYLLNFTFEDLLQFEFSKERNDVTSDNMTINVLKEYFMNSVNPKLVPQGWLENHLQLILWKLISYEIKFKSVITCSVRNVLDQLKYRYDKELYNAQRPALRKIFEKDDVPSKTMILCVIGIYLDDIIVPRVTEISSNIELLLTDGWYSIRCNIDRMLKELVCNGKIAVGCKIVTSGAELLACEQGVSPWEDTSAVRLKIFGNSTCRAHWDARLGYVNYGPILCPLSSIQVSGGKVSKLRVFITRVYPTLYVEKFEDGSTVTRSERLETIHQMKSEVERQAFMEKLYEEVEREFTDQKSQDSGTLSDSYKQMCMESGSQIAKLMKRSKDPTEFRAHLTNSQLHLLEAHTAKSRDRLIEDIQARVRERLEKAGACASRNVISLLKIRVAGVMEKGENVDVSKAMMTIWKPNDAMREVIKEGVWVDVLNVLPTAIRYSEIQISAGRQSVFSDSRYKEPDKFKPYTKLLQRQCYTIKDLVQNPAMSTDYNEIDTVGLIFLVDPSIKEFDSTKQSFQNIYLADADKNMICINFWGGLEKFGFQNILDTGQVTASVNLQKRAGNTRKSIPQFRVTEFSYFTQTPKNKVACKMLDDLNKKLVGVDRIKFCQECSVRKNNYLLSKNNENISPYRFMNTNINTSKNKVFIDSPLLRPNKIDDNFNLTGLDFESTFKQDTQLSEQVLKGKKKVNEKIARLKMYGEPPPLSPMHIINRSKKACNSYKSPLLSSNHDSSIILNNTSVYQNVNENPNGIATDNVLTKSDSSVSVTNIDKTPQKCVAQCDISNSPVLLNRTYVKAVNPVKINFDVQENNNSSVDHFAEEFDGSPPLSLD